MAYIMGGVEWNNQLGASFAPPPGVKFTPPTAGGGRRVAQVKTPSAVMALAEARAASKTSKLGATPLARVLTIFKPKMAFIRDVVDGAFEIMGVAANLVLPNGVSLAAVKPVQSNDSRLPPDTREYVQNMRVIAAFSILVSAPPGIGHGPLAYGFAKALVKSGKWPKARLDRAKQVASKAINAAKKLASSVKPPPMPSLPAPPPPPPPPPRLRMSGLSGPEEDQAGAEVSAGASESGTSEQLSAGKDAAVITPEMVAAAMEILKLGMPMATKAAEEAVAMVQDTSEKLPLPGQQASTAAPKDDDSGTSPLVYAALAAVGFVAYKQLYKN